MIRAVLQALGTLVIDSQLHYSKQRKELMRFQKQVLICSLQMLHIMIHVFVQNVKLKEKLTFFEELLSNVFCNHPDESRKSYGGGGDRPLTKIRQPNKENSAASDAAERGRTFSRRADVYQHSKSAHDVLVYRSEDKDMSSHGSSCKTPRTRW